MLTSGRGEGCLTVNFGIRKSSVKTLNMTKKYFSRLSSLQWWMFSGRVLHPPYNKFFWEWVTTLKIFFKEAFFWRAGLFWGGSFRRSHRFNSRERNRCFQGRVIPMCGYFLTMNLFWRRVSSPEKCLKRDFFPRGCLLHKRIVLQIAKVNSRPVSFFFREDFHLPSGFPQKKLFSQIHLIPQQSRENAEQTIRPLFKEVSVSPSSPLSLDVGKEGRYKRKKVGTVQISTSVEKPSTNVLAKKFALRLIIIQNSHKSLEGVVHKM